ncbi:MAG: hypothetical protein ACREMA_11565 [Longimicrobiales bacterium]
MVKTIRYIVFLTALLPACGEHSITGLRVIRSIPLKRRPPWQ